MNYNNIRYIHPRATLAHLGLIPDMLNEADPAPAVEQLNRGYTHGGGWRPFKGFKMGHDRLIYPGDPPFMAIAEMKLRDERVVLYTSDWVAIIQPDGSFEVSRMD